MKVIKRNGNKVGFDRNKILNAVIKAFKDVYPKKSIKLKRTTIHVRIFI